MPQIQGIKGDAVRQRTVADRKPLITPQVGRDRLSHWVNKMRLFCDYISHSSKHHEKITELNIYITNLNT